jgi:hypothetical protein
VARLLLVWDQGRSQGAVGQQQLVRLVLAAVLDKAAAAQLALH